MKTQCIKCNEPLSRDVFDYSMDYFNVPLCRYDQDLLRNVKSTIETKLLYLGLLRVGIPAQIEKFDGYKTIDIAIPAYKLNIEVDGNHHYTNIEQIYTDMLRMNYSLDKGYYTVRIPNLIIKKNIEIVVKHIMKIIEERDHPRYSLSRKRFYNGKDFY